MLGAEQQPVPDASGSGSSSLFDLLLSQGGSRRNLHVSSLSSFNDEHEIRAAPPHDPAVSHLPLHPALSFLSTPDFF